jgi:hypothetical protein
VLAAVVLALGSAAGAVALARGDSRPLAPARAADAASPFATPPAELSADQADAMPLRTGVYP